LHFYRKPLCDLLAPVAPTWMPFLAKNRNPLLLDVNLAGVIFGIGVLVDPFPLHVDASQFFFSTKTVCEHQGAAGLLFHDYSRQDAPSVSSASFFPRNGVLPGPYETFSPSWWICFVILCPFFPILAPSPCTPFRITVVPEVIPRSNAFLQSSCHCRRFCFTDFP